MFKKLSLFVLITLIAGFLIGCTEASGKEEEPKLVKDHSKTQTAIQERVVMQIVQRNLGLTAPEDDIYKKEEPDLSQYPREVKEEGLEYTVEHIENDFMTRYSVRMRTAPSENSERVDYIRPGQKAIATEKTVIDGEEWFYVQKGELFGWSLGNGLYNFDSAEVTNRRNNAGSRFGKTVYAPRAINLGTAMQEYSVVGMEHSDFHKAMEKEIELSNSFLYTWGGVGYFDGYDAKSTHFVVDGKTAESINDEILITDDHGGAFYYIKSREYKVDFAGIGIEDGVDYWDEIVGAGNTEKVTIQITDDFEVSKIVEYVEK